MLSVSMKKLSKQRKIQIIIATILVVFIAGAVTFVTITNSLTKKKVVTAIKTNASKVIKATATTEDVTSDLNAINNKSSSLDGAIDGASAGLTDQQGNLTY